MSHINIEIKAKTNQTDEIRQFLLKNGADFKGVDMQTDTYFNVLSGRLKLREGNIENSLIFYQRDNIRGAKQSDFELLEVDHESNLKLLLTKAIGVKIEVVKRREIYFIDNVKFHLDVLEPLGHFVEIEATNKTPDVTVEDLRRQCNFYQEALGIHEEDLVSGSYSDMLLSS